MIIDGKKIAEEIKKELKERVSVLSMPATARDPKRSVGRWQAGRKPILSIVYVGSDTVIDQFISIKKRFGEDIGVKIEILKFEESLSQEDLQEEIKKISEKSDGIIIQLPLPFIFSTDEVLNYVPIEKDVDVLTAKATQAFLIDELNISPPVIGAIKEIFDRYQIDVEDKKIVVIGEGRLVGAPVVMWLKKKGINPFVITEETNDITQYLKNADIIISGAGSPGLIKHDMIKEGVVLIDAGVSVASPFDKAPLHEGRGSREQGKKIQGDAEPDCMSKASLFTPVPGGIGPITVAMLFRNLIMLIEAAES